MARRVLKPLTPVLIALVAIVLGFLAIGPSFAGDVPIPASTPSVSTTPQVSVAPSPSGSRLSSETLPTGLPKPKVPKIINPSEASCSSCMAPKID